MIRNWKTTLYNYRHAALLLYFVPYMLWFGWLQGNARPEHWAGSWIDTLIPFQEVFVIPYLLWFFYVAAAVGYFLVRSKPDYFRLCAFLFGGMTVCLAIYTVSPTARSCGRSSSRATTYSPTRYARSTWRTRRSTSARASTASIRSA